MSFRAEFRKFHKAAIADDLVFYDFGETEDGKFEVSLWLATRDRFEVRIVSAGVRDFGSEAVSRVISLSADGSAHREDAHKSDGLLALTPEELCLVACVTQRAMEEMRDDAAGELAMKAMHDDMLAKGPPRKPRAGFARKVAP